MIQTQARIKVAIQKNGRLTEHCLELLQQCGLKYSRGRDQLIGYGENMPVDILLVRDDDIPGLVRDDVCDLGICGFNVLEEKRLAFATKGISQPFKLLQKLDYGQCRLAFAYPEGSNLTNASQLNGETIATSYPRIVEDYLKRHKLKASVVEFSGAVEIAPSLGRAQVICDLVSTGATLAANRLVEGETDFAERGMPGPDSDRYSARENGMGEPSGRTYRRCAASAWQQVHHDACTAFGAARNQRTASRRRITNGTATGRR